MSEGHKMLTHNTAQLRFETYALWEEQETLTQKVNKALHALKEVSTAVSDLSESTISLHHDAEFLDEKVEEWLYPDDDVEPHSPDLRVDIWRYVVSVLGNQMMRHARVQEKLERPCPKRREKMFWLKAAIDEFRPLCKFGDADE